MMCTAMLIPSFAPSRMLQCRKAPKLVHFSHACFHSSISEGWDQWGFTALPVHCLHLPVAVSSGENNDCSGLLCLSRSIQLVPWVLFSLSCHCLLAGSGCERCGSAGRRDSAIFPIPTYAPQTKALVHQEPRGGEGTSE